MTLPTIAVGKTWQGTHFARFTPPGETEPVTVYGETDDDAFIKATEYLDECLKAEEEGARPTRDDILAEAARLTSEDRNKNYGNPRINHQRIAAIFTVLLDKKLKPGEIVTASEAALLMVGVKLARLVESPNHYDSFVDGAAYMAIAGEISDTPAEG